MLDNVEDGILLPVWRAEAFIAFLWLDDRAGILAPEFECGRGHHLRILLDEIAIVRPGACGIVHGIDPHLLEGAGCLGGIERQQFAIGVDLPELIDYSDPRVFSTFLRLPIGCMCCCIAFQGILKQLRPGFEGILAG